MRTLTGYRQNGDFVAINAEFELTKMEWQQLLDCAWLAYVDDGPGDRYYSVGHIESTLVGDLDPETEYRYIADRCNSSDPHKAFVTPPGPGGSVLDVQGSGASP